MGQINRKTNYHDLIIDYEDTYDRGVRDAQMIAGFLESYLDLSLSVTKYDIDTISLAIGVEAESTNKNTWGDSEHPNYWKKGCSIPLRKINYSKKYPDRICFWIKLNFYRTRSMICNFDRFGKALKEHNVDYTKGECRAYDGNHVCHEVCSREDRINPVYKCYGNRRVINGNPVRCGMMIIIPWNDSELGLYSNVNGYKEWADYINAYCMKTKGFTFDKPSEELITFKPTDSQIEQFELEFK